MKKYSKRESISFYPRILLYSVLFVSHKHTHLLGQQKDMKKIKSHARVLLASRLNNKWHADRLESSLYLADSLEERDKNSISWQRESRAKVPRQSTQRCESIHISRIPNCRANWRGIGGTWMHYKRSRNVWESKKSSIKRE